MDVAFEPTTDLSDAQALSQGRHGDPFAFLGPHRQGGIQFVRVFMPGALAIDLLARETGQQIGALTPLGPDGVFVGPNPSDRPYLLRIRWPDAIQELLFCHELARRTGKNFDDLKCSSTDRYERAADPKFAAGEVNFALLRSVNRPAVVRRHARTASGRTRSYRPGRSTRSPF